MITANAITSFVRRPSSASKGLLIEQAPWPKGIGRVSKLQIILAAAARMFGLEPPEIDCGIDGDGFATAVHVYPYDPDMHYECGVTSGSLRPPVRSEVTVRENVSFAMTDQAAVKYPLRELVSIDWLDDVWSEDGSVIARPSLSIEGETVSCGTKIYGTALVEYRTTRYIHAMRVAPMADAVENVFQSVFWANWNGGVKLLVIEAPEGAEEDFAADIRCTGGSVVNLPPDDPDRPPVPSKDRTITLDYCEDFS